MVELGTRGAIERAPVGNSPPAAARTVFLPDSAIAIYQSEKESAHSFDEFQGKLMIIIQAQIQQSKIRF